MGWKGRRKENSSNSSETHHGNRQIVLPLCPRFLNPELWSCFYLEKRNNVWTTYSMRIIIGQRGDKQANPILIYFVWHSRHKGLFRLHITFYCIFHNKNRQVPKRSFFFFSSSSGGETFPADQLGRAEEREAVLFMLELTWETDKTLLYGSAIPFMYNIWVNRSLHPWPTSSRSLLPGKLWD